MEDLDKTMQAINTVEQWQEYILVALVMAQDGEVGQCWCLNRTRPLGYSSEINTWRVGGEMKVS